MTDEPEAVDLSPLDPARDPARWALGMEATRRRVAAVLDRRSRELDPIEIVGGWSRPILAAAASLFLLFGAAAVMLGTPGAPATSETRRLAQLAEQSVMHGRPPTGAEVMRAIGRRGLP